MNKINTYISILSILTNVILNISCSQEDMNTCKLQVFAAAGTYEPLNEIISEYKRINDIEIILYYAYSGTLARQIEQQAIPDIYISASTKWMNYTENLKLIKKGTIINLAKDKLALICPIDSPFDSVKIDHSFEINKLIGQDRFSMGDYHHVPAGEYAMQALEHFGWFNDVREKILPTKDVRSTLMVVEMAEVPLGISYYAIASKSDKVKIIGLFPDQSHKPIVFTAGICSENPIAGDFINYLNTTEAILIWQKHGFETETNSISILK